MRGLVLQPVTSEAAAALAQQIACWARTASGLTDSAVVQYNTCCASPSGETLGRWIITPEACTQFGPMPFTSRGEPIVCDPAATQLRPYYIYETDVVPIDPNTCEGDGPDQLDAPTGLVAAATGQTEASVSWGEVENATGYTVTYWPTGSPDQSQVLQVSDLSVDLSGLTMDTGYTVQVVAVDGTGEHQPSAPAQTTFATPPEPMLATPQNLTISDITVSGAMVSWDAVPNAQSYGVTWTLIDGTEGVGVPVTGTSYNITGLDQHTGYIVSVVATAPGYTDSLPATDQFTTEQMALATPGGLDAGTPTIDGTTVTWGAVDNADGYTVSWALASAPTVPIGSVPVTGTSHTIDGLEADTDYVVSVVATDSTDTYADSMAATAPFTTAPLPALAAPTFDSVAIVDAAAGTVAVNASAVADPNGMEYTLNPGGQTQTQPPGSAGASFTGLEADTEYTYTVIALGDGESNVDSDPLTGTFTYAGELDDPLSVTGQADSPTSGTVTWSAVTGAASYTVTVDDGTDPAVEITEATSPQAVTGLEADTAYTATVVAVGTPSSTSTAGPTLSVDSPGAVTDQFTTPDDQLAAPTGLATSAVTDTGATATWDAVTGADGYTVEWALASAPETPIGSESVAATTYAIDGLDASTEYVVSVVATDSTGTYTDSVAATSQFTTEATPVLPTPSGLAAGTPTTTGATVSWDAVTGADGYTVSWALASAPETPIGTESATGTSHTIDGLDPSTEYVVSVVATDSTGSFVDSEPGTLSFTTAAPPALAAPTLDNVTIDAESDLVTISVDVDSDPNGTQYTLNPGNQSTTEPSGSLSAAFSGVTADTTYTYTVTALGDGTTNLDSDELEGTFTYAGELDDPASVTADPVSATSATVTWDAVTGAASYDLTVTNDGEPSETITVTGATSPQTVDSLTAATAYTAAVVAVGSLTSTSTAGPVLGTDSLGETVAQFTTPAAEEEALAAPTGLSLSEVTPLGATLDWEPVDGAEEYTVSWALSLTPEVQLGSVTTTDTSYGLLGLLAGTLYVVTVTAHASGQVGSVGASIELETALGL